MSTTTSHPHIGSSQQTWSTNSYQYCLQGARSQHIRHVCCKPATINSAHQLVQWHARRNTLHPAPSTLPYYIFSKTHLHCYAIHDFVNTQDPTPGFNIPIHFIGREKTRHNIIQSNYIETERDRSISVVCCPKSNSNSICKSIFFERTTLDECVSIDIEEEIQDYVPGRS